ncbi:hypothetical protein VSDG_01325 [Cytospora chrysosperma]|uniref:Uncharacterized protein n=1 Tax=Cytospora chrysosperma TaxID=252740 RepID=A0A423WJC6_CYTCH|nr:hypothetical protein VSDG_01325 [Valsa sordida]
MSPVSSTFGHDPAEQPYRTVAVPDHHQLKALVHRLARHGDNRIGTIPEQTILGGGGQLPCHGQDSSRAPGYTALELIVPALRVPLQPGELEVLLRCLHEAPDVRQPLATTGCPPLSRLADLFFEHLSSRGRRDAAGAGAGAGDDVLRAVNECFGHLIGRGADPDVLVGGRPLLFRLLGAPAETGAFGPMWESVQRLARLALPVVQQQQQPQQQQQQHQKQEGYRGCGPTKAPPNALHALLEGASSSSSPSSASAAATPSEVQNRAYLMTAVLIPRLAALGRLDDRGGAQGLSAFELYVRGGLAAAGDDMGQFLHVSAEFVRHGAGAGSGLGAGVVPPAFAGDVQAACRTGVLGGRLQQGRQGAGPLWASVWVSACRLSLVGADGAVVDDHLSLLEYITKGRARAEACRSVLPRPPPSLSQLQPVDLASPGTGSDGTQQHYSFAFFQLRLSLDVGISGHTFSLIFLFLFLVRGALLLLTFCLCGALHSAQQCLVQVEITDGHGLESNVRLLHDAEGKRTRETPLLPRDLDVVIRVLLAIVSSVLPAVLARHMPRPPVLVKPLGRVGDGDLLVRIQALVPRPLEVDVAVVERVLLIRLQPLVLCGLGVAFLLQDVEDRDAVHFGLHVEDFPHGLLDLRGQGRHLLAQLLDGALGPLDRSMACVAVAVAGVLLLGGPLCSLLGDPLAVRQPLVDGVDALAEQLGRRVQPALVFLVGAAGGQLLQRLLALGGKGALGRFVGWEV